MWQCVWYSQHVEGQLILKSSRTDRPVSSPHVKRSSSFWIWFSSSVFFSVNSTIIHPVTQVWIPRGILFPHCPGSSSTLSSILQIALQRMDWSFAHSLSLTALLRVTSLSTLDYPLLMILLPHFCCCAVHSLQANLTISSSTTPLMPWKSHAIPQHD